MSNARRAPRQGLFTRRQALGLAAVGAAGLVLGCSREGAARGGAGLMGRLERSLLEEGKRAGAPEVRAVACWGDSMTKGTGASEAHIMRDGAEVFDASGLSYPEVLRWLTGLPVYNYGIEGATSDEIVRVQEALAQGGVEGIESLVGTLPGARQSPGDVLVLEIGSNGGWDGTYDVLISQYQAMIDRAGAEHFLILGDTDDPGTSPADGAQAAFEPAVAPGPSVSTTAWEDALSAAFAGHFFNVRRYLLERGLAAAGLAPAGEDEELALRGCISPRLRADWTHLNSYGYFAKAVGVFGHGVELGYWEASELAWL